MKKLAIIICMAGLSGCKTNYENLPAFSESKQVQVVIETPAGSAHEYHYNPDTNSFRAMQESGRDKAIRFLPYPVNTGFIPSTRQNKKGKGGPLQAILLSERLDAGTITETMPLGVLLLENDGELDYQVITVPAKPSQRLLEATDYAELNGKYPAVKKILETWFLHYKPENNIRIMGWKDEKFADELIRKHMN